MKAIKLVIITVLVSMFTSGISGQEYKIQVQNPKEGKLILKNFVGKLPVTGYSGNEVVISTNSGNFAPPEKAKGLKAIYPAGTDNTGLGLDVQKNGGEITVTCLLPIGRDEEYSLKVPENMVLEVERGCERSDEVVISGMKNELDINNCHDISLKNVSGPLILSSISGDINITFGPINSDKPFSINTVSGDIDVTLPAKTATNIEMHTINGGFYSDFDFADSKKDLKKVGGNELTYSLNGGGFKFSIVTVSGNIFLRKGI